MRWIPTVAFVVGCSSQTAWPEAPPPDPCAAGALPDEELVLRFSHGGHPRAALVWPGASAGPRDVVVNLHELRAEPRRQGHYSGWVPFAREIGAILVGPDGRAATWNAGGCCGKAAAENTDDVGYLDALLARLGPSACPTGKVLATGIGNGAMMAHRWACESDVVDAVVSVGGALQLGDCPVRRPIPVLHLHGADDTFYPAAGGPEHRSVEDGLAVWRRRNGVVGDPIVETDGDVTCTTWVGDAPVRSCVVAGMGAAWPGAADTEIDGRSPMADATRGAYRWVQAHW